MVLEKRRDKLEIIGSILSICNTCDATKTKIVYKANLNFKMAGIYLDWLISKEMVIKNEKHYNLTPKGKQLLSSLHEISPLFLEGS